MSIVLPLPEANGKRVGFEGVSMMKLSDGKIAEYSEVANVGPAFVELGFAGRRADGHDFLGGRIDHVQGRRAGHAVRP